MNWIYDPWPWYVGGPLIALVMLLLLLNDKKFGMSSNLRTICAAFGAGKSTPFFDYDWKSQRWNIVVIIGVFAGVLQRNTYPLKLLLIYIPMWSCNCKNSIFSTLVRHTCPKHSLETQLGQTEVFINFSSWWIFGWFWSSLRWWLYLRSCDFRSKQSTTTFVDCSHRIFYWGNYYESLPHSLYTQRTLTYFFLLVFCLALRYSSLKLPLGFASMKCFNSNPFICMVSLGRLLSWVLSLHKASNALK